MTAAQPESNQPGSNWLPIGKAPFYFLPEYSPAGRVWQQNIGKLLDRLIGEGAQVSYPEADVAEVRLAHMCLSVDAGDGEIAIEIRDGFGVRGGADEIISSATERFPEFADETERLAKLASDIWSAMQAAFASAVDEGRVRVLAQEGSLLGPFRPIGSHQAKFFDFELERQDVTGKPLPATATGPAGEVMFCPYIVPPKSSAASDVELEMIDWLISEKRARQNLTKEALFDAARIKWGKVSDERLKKIWKDARGKSSELPWSRRGPKRK